jgi:DNA-directed RNA polymerase subunit RPC12/RpoP
MAVVKPAGGAKEVISQQKAFGTPVVVIGSKQTLGKKRVVISTDEAISQLLENRKKDLLVRAQNAQLEVAIAEDERAATKLELDKRRMQEDGRSPEEESEMSIEQRIDEAAEVTAAAVENGVPADQARALGTGKAKVVIVGKPLAAQPSEVNPNGGWLVIGGQPMKDPDGPYTFIQALQVAALNSKPAETANSEIKALVDELKNQSRQQQENNMKAIVDSVKVLTDEVKTMKATPVARPAENPATRQRATIFIQDPNNPANVITKVLEPGDVHFIPASPKPPTGQSLEEKRLELEHEARMAEINQGKDKAAEEKMAKQETRAMIGKAIEQISTVGAAIISEATGKKSAVNEQPAAKANLVYLRCGSCGFSVPVPADQPEGNCPKCGKFVFPCEKCGATITASPNAPQVECPACKYKLFNNSEPAPATAPASSSANPPANQPPAAPVTSTPLPEGQGGEPG